MKLVRDYWGYCVVKLGKLIERVVERSTLTDKKRFEINKHVGFLLDGIFEVL